MTEETPEVATPGLDDASPRRDVEVRHTLSIDSDWVLDLLVSVANDSKSFSVNLTLNLGGSFIFGDLIGGPVWADLMDQALRSANGTGAAEFADALAPVRKMIEEANTTREDDPGLPLRFLHLKNARTFLGDGTTFTMGLWRGRLTEISGWTFGTPTRS